MIGLIYILFDEAKPDHVRYVGQTTRGDRLMSHIKEARRGRKQTHKALWIRQVLRNDGVVGFKQIDTADSTDELLSKEVAWIRHYRDLGHRLTNSTDGGEGSLSPLPDVRKKMSDAAKGRVHSEASKAKMSASQKRRPPRGPMSAAQRLKMSIVATGRILSPEHRAKVSAALTGRPCSEETRRKMSAAQKGKPRGPLSDAHRAAVSASLLGRVFTPEHRRNLSASLRGRTIARVC